MNDEIIVCDECLETEVDFDGDLCASCQAIEDWTDSNFE